MANKREIDTILENFEDEYTHDLAIHLYSTHLLHQVDPIFPRENWSSWPQSFDTVPDPKTVTTYMHDNPFNVENDESDQESTRTKSFHGVKVQERITSSESDLKLELKALIERKIYSKVHQQLKKNTGKPAAKNLVPVVEIKDYLIRSMVDKLTGQVDDILDALIETRLVAATRRHGKKLMNWLDVLLAKLNADIENNENVDVIWYRDIYARLTELFAFQYKYEYEESPVYVGNTELNGDEDIVDAESNTDEASEEGDEDGESDGDDADDDLVVPVFDYDTFVDEIDSKKRRLPDSRSQLSYQHYKIRTQRKKSSYETGMQAKRQTFLKTLEVRERLQALSWENKFNIPRKKLKATRHIPESFDISEQEKRALAVSSLAIDEDTYIT
ncbi:hypothetical protein CLIB1423_09S04368 [[Candida] railenensis]|uniref:Rrn9 domain-containing protein n=1 Tax=[Candida] railenensis TaxID=45579 RepID=A0A9P0QR72_9ASCO|nr:hypothetical protein CLIB1423_09S04368 [[Candida] railenensis]